MKTKQSIQRITLKNCIESQNEKFLNVQASHKKSGKEKTEETRKNKIVDLSPNTAMITLNINGLHVPIRTETGQMD